MIREKRHRLPREAYRGFRVVFITACLKNEAPFFITHERFSIFEGMLLESIEQFECDCDVYLFMPDHAHFIVRGKSEKANVLRTMDLFKQYSGFWFSRNHPSVRWQKDFHDRILRKNDSVIDVVKYILNNPVRKELVENWKTYIFKGSTIHGLDEWESL